MSKIDFANSIAILKQEMVNSRMVINQYLSNVAKSIKVTVEVAEAAVTGYADQAIPLESKAKAKHLAMKLYAACAAIVKAKELGLDESYLFKFRKLIEYMVNLKGKNKYLSNIITDGDGWKLAFPVNGKWPLPKSRLAAIITIVNNREFVVFEDDGNYLIPNLDYQIGDGVGFNSLIAAFKEADNAVKDNQRIIDDLRKRTDVNASDVIKNVDKETKKLAKEGKKKKERKRVQPVYVSKCGGGGSSDDGWETAAKVGLACLAGVGLVYAGYKANEYFSSTEVVSSNKFGPGWGWK